MAWGQLNWEDGTSASVELQGSVCIPVVYPHLNQGERVSPLVNSQQNLDSMVGGGAQDGWKSNQ